MGHRGQFNQTRRSMNATSGSRPHPAKTYMPIPNLIVVSNVLLISTTSIIAKGLVLNPKIPIISRLYNRQRQTRTIVDLKAVFKAKKIKKI